MYVKRMSAAGPQSGDEFAFNSGRNTIDIGGAASRNLMTDMETSAVPFGDPRSVTQCLNFSRKRLPYLPE